MPNKTHEERIQICLDRLKQEGFFINPAMINFKTQLEIYFKNEKKPEIVTKNLLHMHQKNFNFKDPEVQKLLFTNQEYSSVKVIAVLNHRELFFKYGFEHPLLFARELKQCPALFQFKEDNVNKDQTSSMYFGLQVLESNRCFTTNGEANFKVAKNNAIKLLAELDERTYKYRIQETGEEYEEQSIDLLPERVARNFIELIDQGYTGMFVWQENSREAHGLTENKLKLLANPSNDSLYQSMVNDDFWSAVKQDFSGMLGRASESATNQCNASITFSQCWAAVRIKNTVLDLINADDNKTLRLKIQNCAIDKRSFSVTPDFLRKAFLRLPSSPKSEFNRKLVVIQQQALLETIDHIMRSDSINPIEQNIKVTLRKNNVTLAVDWADILMKLPIENFSEETIMQRTLFSALAQLSPEESRKALGLEKLNEAQQAQLILELQKNGYMITGSFDYVSNLLIKSSSAHADLLVSYFLANKYDWKNQCYNLKDLTQLVQWTRTHRETLNQSTLECIDTVINNSLKQSIPHIKIGFFANNGEYDQLHQIWEKVKKSADLSTKRAYSTIKRARESDPINTQTISLLISDYMTQNPESVYTLELQNVYGDFFKEFTPSNAPVHSANDDKESGVTLCSCA